MISAARTERLCTYPSATGWPAVAIHDRNGLRGSHHGWHRNTAVDDDHVGREGGQLRRKRRKAREAATAASRNSRMTF